MSSRNVVEIWNQQGRVLWRYPLNINVGGNEMIHDAIAVFKTTFPATCVTTKMVHANDMRFDVERQAYIIDAQVNEQ